LPPRGPAPEPTSFPTRRSSDLGEGAKNGGIAYISTFQTRMDAARAAAQAFKNMPIGIAEALRSSDRTRQIMIDETINVRFAMGGDRKSTRLNSSHRTSSYAVYC